MSILLRDAEVEGARVDVRIEGDRIAAVGPAGAAGSGADVEIPCRGGALLPGLHDHHVHLLSMEAAMRSLDVSGQLDARIAGAHATTPPDVPIRAVNYDEVTGGPLDRRRLDALAPGRSVRVQHRSGRSGSSVRPPWPRSASSATTCPGRAPGIATRRGRASRGRAGAFRPAVSSASTPGCTTVWRASGRST